MSNLGPTPSNLCPNCNNPFPANRPHCRSCGLKRDEIQPDGKIKKRQTIPPVLGDVREGSQYNCCSYCQTQLGPNVRICPKCGQSNQIDTSGSPLVSWALVLTLIFVVPVAAFGACVVYPRPNSYDHMYDAVALAMGIQIMSLGLGLIFVFLNLRAEKEQQK